MSRIAPIARGAMTKALVSHLGTELEPGILVGRGTAPKDGGWSGGQPGAGTFQPYATVRAGRAQTPAPGEPPRLGVSRTSWLLGYRLAAFDVSESRVSDVMDDVAAAMALLEGSFTLRSVEWELQQVVFGGMGDVLPNNSTNPPYWQTTLDVSLHLSRVQAR